MTPVARDRPQLLVRIHGEADPTLQVEVQTRWLTVAERCGRAPGLLQRLDGATPTPWSLWVAAPVRRDGRQYEATVALDHFEAGECAWHPFVIGFLVTHEEGVTTGQFVSSGADAGRFEPGPEARIWVDSAVRRAASRQARDDPRGLGQVRPLQLGCRVIVIRGAKGLSCVPDTPRELALITEDAVEVRVDFRDRTRQ